MLKTYFENTPVIYLTSKKKFNKRMKKIFNSLKWIPEFYFILVSVLWFYLTHSSRDSSNSMINFPAILMIVIFHIQLFLNDQMLGKFLAGVIGFASIYMVYAVITEYNVFTDFNYNTQLNTLKIGNVILLNLIMALWMFNKYKPSEDNEPETQTL